jgi:hypothetical protein
MARKSDHERYVECWANRTPAELDLQMQAFDYEEKHFADLRLLAPSIRKRLLAYQAQMDDGSWFDTEDDVNVSLHEWIFKYRRMRDCVGLCDSKARTIYVWPKLEDVEHRACVLHEMIHAYENQLTIPCREWLLLDIYARMSKRIKPAMLKRYMAISTHAMVHNSAHGRLFLLKSLELDLHFHWKLGTVFGYGRADYFAPKRRTSNG